MLRKMVEELKVHKRRVVIFDARQHSSDLVRGIISSLSADEQFVEALLEAAGDALVEGVAALVVQLAPAAARPAVTAAVAAFSKASGKVWREQAAPPEVRLDLLLGAFIEACKSRGEYPIFVIDEANYALATPDEAAKQRTLYLLQLLTRIT